MGVELLHGELGFRAQEGQETISLALDDQQKDGEFIPWKLFGIGVNGSFDQLGWYMP